MKTCAYFVFILLIFWCFNTFSNAADFPSKQYAATIMGHPKETLTSGSEETHSYQIDTDDNKTYVIINMDKVSSDNKRRFFEAMDEGKEIVVTGIIQEYKKFTGILIVSVHPEKMGRTGRINR
ncbi:MAG: hypothetical protein ACP5IL_06975 [Syntrophobacteraceae bacterium]